MAEGVQALDLSQHGLMDNEGHDNSFSPTLWLAVARRNAAELVVAVKQHQFVSWWVTETAAVVVAVKVAAVSVVVATAIVAAVIPATHDLKVYPPTVAV